MKVLVTGGSGFIGSRLVDTLVKRGESVTCLVRNRRISNPSVKTIICDISHPDLVIPDEKYDVVYHLAAAWPGEKNKKILKMINYDGTANLFSRIKGKTKSIVYLSGLGVFGNPGDIVINEDTPFKPHTEYAKIRLEAQKYLESGCKEEGISLSIAFLGDVYGNGGWFKNVMVERLKRGSFRIPGSGEYYRSFVHVDDAVLALLSIANKNPICQYFIITDDAPVKFKDFINLASKELGVKNPGTIPTILAKAVMGADFVNLLTTSLKTSNEKIAKFYGIVYKSYREGIPATISEIKS